MLRFPYSQASQADILWFIDIIKKGVWGNIGKGLQAMFDLNWAVSRLFNVATHLSNEMLMSCLKSHCIHFLNGRIVGTLSNFKLNYLKNVEKFIFKKRLRFIAFTRILFLSVFLPKSKSSHFSSTTFSLT